METTAEIIALKRKTQNDISELLKSKDDQSEDNLNLIHEKWELIDELSRKFLEVNQEQIKKFETILESLNVKEAGKFLELALKEYFNYGRAGIICQKYPAGNWMVKYDFNPDTATPEMKLYWIKLTPHKATADSLVSHFVEFFSSIGYKMQKAERKTDEEIFYFGHFI